MDTPIVSIIVPVYNVETYLHRCVDSILKQTFTSFELLLVDDGSTDGSGRICDDYASSDSRIVVIHKENGGVSSARNVALDRACGKYVCFIDSDDWIEACYLETIVRQVKGYDILFFGFSMDSKNEDSLRLSVGEIRAKGALERDRCLLHLMHNKLGHNLMGYTWDKVFRRDLIEKNKLRFLEHVHFGEDEIFTLAYCLKAHFLKVMPNVIYHYWQRPDSLIHQKDTCLSAKLKFASIVQLIDEMESMRLKMIWHKCAYHTLQNIAKLSSGNYLLYAMYQLKAFNYKRKYLV